MAVSPPVVGLAEDVETGRAVAMEVEVADVVDVVDVDPGAVVDDVDPVAVTIIVVEEVRPPPAAGNIDVSTYLLLEILKLTLCCSAITDRCSGACRC